MAVNFGVNYLAVIVAAVIAIVIGFAYYAPQVMGNRWMSYLGTTRAQLGNPAPTGMAAGVIASLLNAWVLAVLARSLGGATIAGGAVLGLICWLGIIGAVTPPEVAVPQHSLGLLVVNNI